MTMYQKRIHLKERFWPGITIDHNKPVPLSYYAKVICATYDSAIVDLLIETLKNENEQRCGDTVIKGFTK